MKTKNYLFLLLTLLLLSCEGDDIDHSLITGNIKVNAKIDEVKTRASNSSWSQGDIIGIYMKTSGQELSSKSALEKNVKYTTSGDGNFSPSIIGGDIKLPGNGSEVDFIAYYPFKTISTSFDYAIDLTDQSNLEAIDLLYSNNVTKHSRTSTNVALKFSHQLSKIVVNLSSSDVKFQDVSIVLKGLPNKGKFSLIDKSITTSANGNIKMKVSSNNKAAEAIVIPVTNLSNASMEIQVGKTVYVFPLSSSSTIKELEAGYDHTYNIALSSQEASETPVQSNISNWKPGPVDNITVSKSHETEGPGEKGTIDNPYTIGEARKLVSASNIWVKGYIVGSYTGNKVESFSADIEEGKIKDTVLALAELQKESDGEMTFPIQLPQGNIRNSLNLIDNPENIGRHIKIRCKLDKYYGVPGAVTTYQYEFM